MSKFQEKLKKFVEEEKVSGVDQELLDHLHLIMEQDLLYWGLPPGVRKTLNIFFRELHSMLEKELMESQYGSSIVLEGFIVTVFEAGYRLGNSGPRIDEKAVAERMRDMKV